MKWVAALMLGALIAGCGADGEPVQPTRNNHNNLSDTRQQHSNYTPGVHVSGHVTVGVAKGI
ncbi:hypothetical protein [Sulfitobacter geojensis]|jgi:uncharacterized lipoprotein|uniref:hypothetical protein n=1 Tax=Sulfitobacter geojensis TaxID=1342299 RepID=UPI002492247C|nr:hypothetical protein [Sulfitobacter geojensis]